MHQQQNIAITSGEYFLGHELARHLLQQGGKQGSRQGQTVLGASNITIVTEDPSRVQELQSLGAQVTKVDFSNEKSLVDAYQADNLILISVPDERRREKAKIQARALQQAQPKRVWVISAVGCDQANEGALRDYKEFEDLVQQSGVRNYEIIRLSLPQQWFHVWSPNVVQNAKFPLTISEGKRIAPVNLEDVARAIVKLVSQGQQQQRQEGRVYNFTGPDKLDGKEIVKELNHALGTNQIQYEKIEKEALRQFFNSFRDNVSNDFGEKLRDQPTETQSQSIIAGLELAEQRNPDTKNDLHEVLGEHGQRVRQFFEKHGDEFRGGARRA